MTIRIGMELAAPGSPDIGGAWALDLPGCFSPGADEPSALAAVAAAMRRHLALLRDHAIDPPAELGGPVEVVESFQCYWGPPEQGRYEVNAIFSADLAPLTPADVEYARAVLAATRRELLAVADRAGARKPGDRTVDDMLHHVATAEWFYATRLEEQPDRQRQFRREDLRDPRAHLAATRAWVLPRLDALASLGEAERVQRGERWTPRKILRRFIYHELDHIRELEARIPVEA